LKLFSKADDKAPIPADAVTTDFVVAVLLSDMVLMDVGDFRRYHKALWKTKLDCTEVPLARKELGEFQRLKIESEGRTLFLSLRSGPLPGSLLEMMGRMTDISAMGMSPEQAQIDAMKNHKAHAVLGCTTYDDKSDPQKAIDRAWLFVETLCTLLEHRKEFVGYAPISAQVYRPREWILSRLESKNISQNELFMLLCNIRSFPGEQENWMHTLGMEQFCQPDLEVWFKDRGKGDYYFELLMNAAMYSISESVLSLGNTFNIHGDPVTYKLATPREVANHKWGKFGAMGMESIPIP
jgi:hypothetical protein